MEDTYIPYELPDTANHSFFFIDRCIAPQYEAKLHCHDAWELICITHGNGRRTIGDTSDYFAAGDVALLPPSIYHRWDYEPQSVDKDGKVHYLMVAFSRSLVERLIALFPEVRNRIGAISFPVNAIKFGHLTATTIRTKMREMSDMDELGRLSAMITLLPLVFASSDYTFAGAPMRIERNVRRMQKVSEYVMAHFGHHISLDDMASEIGMNRSAFCVWFKQHKGIPFSQFLIQYRLNTACELLTNTKKQVSEICYMVGFNDLPHFVRTFTSIYGVSPSVYRKNNSDIFSSAQP